jgi:hypothetical protein
VVPTLAVIEGGAVSWSAGDLPGCDLFVKPTGGRGGRHTQKWRHGGGRYRRVGGAPTDVSSGVPADSPSDMPAGVPADSPSDMPAGVPADVPAADMLARLAGDADNALMVQPCLANHPELSDLALDAAVTCRIITILDEAGDPEPVTAIFRMPASPGAVVDNMHRGGIAAPVQIPTGVLGTASGYATAGQTTRHTHHPVTGTAVAGRTLPMWDAVRDLAVAAHRAFRPRVLVGWDISIGADGPVLVEGNEQPGVDGLQRLHDRPLGSHRFGELLAFHLSRCTQVTTDPAAR